MSEDYRAKAKEICGDAKAVEELLKENHELKRTRSEAEATAELKGYNAGMAEMKRQLGALNIKVG